MKRLLSLSVVLIFLTTGFLSAGIEQGLKHKLKNYFNNKKFAILQVGELPALPKQGFLKKGITLSIHNGGRWQQKRTLGMVRVSDLKIKKGETMQINKLKYTSKGITIIANTFRKLPTGAPAEYKHLRIKFLFTFDESYLGNNSISNFRFISKSVERYFTFFRSPEKAEHFKKYGAAPSEPVSVAQEVPQESTQPTPAVVEKPVTKKSAEAVAAQSANSTVKLNMTISEVEKLLGAPLKRATEDGTRLKYDYGDITVIFEKGKVVSVVY